MSSISSGFIYKPDTKTAILYSIAELGYFLVEFNHKGRSWYIEKKDKPQQFENISLAKEAALDGGAVEIYEAIEITYDEIGNTQFARPRFDYNKLL